MKITLFRSSLFLFTFFLLSITSFSQSIYFSEGVDDDGYPINESSVFTIPDEGGYLYVLVRLPYQIECSSALFDIERNGIYENTIYMDVKENWVWFYKQIDFYKSGRYEFHVYDCYDYLLVSGTVKIEYYWNII